MADFLGTVAVPEVSPSGTFPLQVQWPFVETIAPAVVIHQFGAGNAKREQRFQLGDGTRLWQLSLQLTDPEVDALLTFYDDHQGSTVPFTFNAPDENQATTAVTVQFENEPLVIDRGRGLHQVTVNVREVYTGAGPTYAISATQTRFPSGALATALATPVQVWIPMLKIRPKKASYPDVFISDRRCTIGGQLYLPRLTELPEIRQTASGVPGIDSETEDTTFKLGNADRVMRDLAQSVTLDYARVEYSLFNVATGMKLDLWAGEIGKQGWSVESEIATIRCTDFLANPFLIFPNRTVDRSCTAPFNKAPLCPYSTAGALDLTHFPSADGAVCDHGFWTDNGCMAHGMARYYRGVPLSPQPFRSKDNSGGFFARLVRSTFTSLSQVSDSIMGKPLPAIYTDTSLPVKALLALFSDQGDFKGGVGIIGIGPLGALGDPTKHTLDGQPQFDVKYPPRGVLGSEPAGATDYLSQSYNGDQTNGDWMKAYVGNSTFIRNLAAGVAFLDMLVTDEKGEQFTRIDDHDMEVIVAQGLSGKQWSAPGTAATALLTNPFWVAVDVLLQGYYMKTAATGDQEGLFDVDAAIAAAGIADLVVDKIVGSGTETQFKVNGSLVDSRPLKDWIDDILKNCLGTRTTVFGKVRFGCRSNTSSVAAFTAGNLLFGSVAPDPPTRSYNRKVITFADQVKDTITGETLYLPNTATAYDEDYALELGGGDRALYYQAEGNLPLTANISQAQRIANTELREEVGGIDESERLQHRIIRASSTILGLDFACGDVVSVADDALPGGFQEMRVGTWRLGPDYRLDWQGPTVRDSMYDLISGPRPADVLADGIPPEEQPYPFRMQWQPNTESPIAGDPIYPSGWNTFGLQQRYVPKGDGGKQALLDVIGVQPVNEFLPDTYPPVIRTCTPATTGGSLKGDRAYWISVCPFVDGEGVGPPCKLRAVKTAAGTDTNKFTLSDITWPAPPAGMSWDGYVVFVAIDDERTSCSQSYVTGALPSSIDVAGPLKISTWGVPNTSSTRLLVQAKHVEHFGLFGEQVTAVATNSVTIARLAGLTDDYTGRILEVVADQSDGSANLRHFTVTAHNLTTGELTVTPDPDAAGIEVGDLATVLLEANIFTGSTIGDAKFINGIYPDGLGLDPTHEKDLLIYGFYKDGSPHQIRRILSHTQTTYTVDKEFTVKPDWFIVAEAAYRYQAYSQDIHNLHSDAKFLISVPVENLVDQPMMVAPFIQDKNGNLTPEELAPIRYTFIFGETGTTAAADDGFYDAPIVSNHIAIDLANGLNQHVLLNQATKVIFDDPIFTGGTIKPGSWMMLYVDIDGTGGYPTPGFGSAYGADVTAQQHEFSTTANTRTALGLTYDGTKWRVDSFTTGLPI